jgi:hypothetical protein
MTILSLSLFFVLLRRFLIQYYETKLLKRSFPSGLKIEDKLNSRKFHLNWRFDMHILHVIIWSSSMELWWDLNYSIQRWVNLIENMTLLIINIKSDIVGSLIWDFGCLLKEYICLKNISNWHLFIYILKIKKFKKYFQVKNTFHCNTEQTINS